MSSSILANFTNWKKKMLPTEFNRCTRSFLAAGSAHKSNHVNAADVLGADAKLECGFGPGPLTH